MARIPLIAYPAAFAGALVAGRALSGGGAGPATDTTTPTTTPTATTADDGWTGFDGAGTQLGGDGTGGVLQSPITTPNPATPTPSVPSPGSTVVDINGRAPDRIGVRPAGATGWIVVRGPVYWYSKTSSGTYNSAPGTAEFSAWVGSPFTAKGSKSGSATVVRILSGAHNGQVIGIATSAGLTYTAG